MVENMTNRELAELMATDWGESSEIENFKPCLLEIENFEAESLLKNLKFEFPISEKKEGTETPCFLEFREGHMEIPDGTVVIDGDWGK